MFKPAITEYLYSNGQCSDSETSRNRTPCYIFSPVHGCQKEECQPQSHEGDTSDPSPDPLNLCRIRGSFPEELVHTAGIHLRIRPNNIPLLRFEIGNEVLFLAMMTHELSIFQGTLCRFQRATRQHPGSGTLVE
jgi:hypothetical protein